MAQQVTTKATLDSLETVLQSNLKLQTKVVRRIQAIAKRKADNRRMASRITSQLVATWKDIDMLRMPLPAPQSTRKRKKSGDDPSTSFKWKYDPFRKWTRRFFVDPDGSMPPPNDDTVKRRRLEQGTFSYQTCPPWSNKEVEALRSIVEDDKTKSEDVDFAQVARTLEERMKSADKKSKSPPLHARSSQDCRLKYADMKSKPFTKQESMQILEQVHVHNGKPPWKDVAASLHSTPFKCLQHYETKLKSTRSLPWTPAEDEVLLKYVAAMGPQWVLSSSSAALLATHVLPVKNPKQILARANASLVNPNLVRDAWSMEEERKLALCMKVYRDTPNPITRAAAHFPNRANKSVTEKWDRSLNPEYNTKPFTPEEDQALLEAVRASPNAGWVEISQSFAGRKPRSLNNRWNELATQEDLLQKYGNATMKRQRVVSKGLLEMDDFVVRVKKEE